MRPLAEADFAANVTAGLVETLAPANAVCLGLDFPAADLPPLSVAGVATGSLPASPAPRTSPRR